MIGSRVDWPRSSQDLKLENVMLNRPGPKCWGPHLGGWMVTGQGDRPVVWCTVAGVLMVGFGFEMFWATDGKRLSL